MAGRTLAVAGVVATIAIGAVLAWSGTRLYEQIEGFARTGVPGAVTIGVDRPGTQVIYMEPGMASGAANVGIEVRAPDGLRVPVLPAGSDIQYHLLGYDGRAIASFHASEPGLYRLTAEGAAFGTLAVGGSLTGAIVAVALSCVGFVGLVVVGLLVLASFVLQRRDRNRPGWTTQTRVAA